MSHTVDPIVGKKEFESQLEYELRQAKGLQTNPAVIIFKPKDPSLSERIARELLCISKNLGTEENKQFIDYVANYDNQPAVILSRADGYVNDISKLIQQEIESKLGPIEFEKVFTAHYDGANDTVKDMLARAFKL